MSIAPLSFTHSVTRTNRALMVLMVDCSASMQSVVSYNGNPISRIQILASMVNDILRELVFKSRVNGEIRDYYDVAIVAYNGDGVFPIFQSGDDDSPMRSIVDIAQMGDGNTMVSFEALTPFSDGDETLRKGGLMLKPTGDTPMLEALYFVYTIVEEWCAKPENGDSIPPFIANVTDGHPTDSSLKDIERLSQSIKGVSTADGEALLLNIYLDDTIDSNAPKMLFPTDEELKSCHDEFLRGMALSASILPACFESVAREVRGDHAGARSESGYRAVGLGVSVEEFLSMISVGTILTPAK